MSNLSRCKVWGHLWDIGIGPLVELNFGDSTGADSTEVDSRESDDVG
ncbi:MAG: hypothetical protein F6K16_35425 [Symploca sp. SIO2B6]|nr:hypothetical protein [Symploca sp. SIO2B6]